MKFLYYLLGVAALVVGSMCFTDAYRYIMTDKYEAATAAIFGGMFNMLAFVGCMIFAYECDKYKEK
ncbi:hypothetical protein Slash_14 [Bacillus phage Slash]|uniref:Uncharacterized protein n=2 Tax=Slashvirus TaxID=1921709 RepID=U5Q0A4_9CAUD|nr:hypothetical protein Staley_14 [Bacillus phage Staley]YP_008771916.1 hypothetical protein Slash_14 [Bacillus phage Slash]AGY48303.1 hypothetical protein Slash_14 [Bacillus phage Slash]AGY48697.1 hypothetical protein Staley_14 [Bacillus phage Staley]